MLSDRHQVIEPGTCIASPRPRQRAAASYRARNLLERFFNKIKRCRRLNPLGQTRNQLTLRYPSNSLKIKA